MSGAVDDGAFDALLDLQDVDIALAQAAHRRVTLPERAELDAVLAARDALVARREALRAEAAPLRVRRDELDAQAAALAARRRELEARLYADRGAARDLAALNDEVAHLADRLTAVEDQELEVMEVLEPVESGAAAVEGELAAAEVALGERREAAEAAQAVVDAEISVLREERAAHATRVPASLLQRYERIRERAGGVGAARLVGDRCSGCHLTLSSVEVDQVRHQDPGSVHTCEQCGRILVAVAPGHGSPASTAAAD